MNLGELKNKTILLFGKSRAFSSEEFESQLKHHGINLVKEYSDDVLLSIDGKMMTPYEQNASDELYESKKTTSINIDIFETELAKEIDEDTLLMSLKLSHDKDRLKSFLQNTAISDNLFLRLLKLYSWNGEDFFENDDNRDVTAALISRFYENIERNHNVQYATLGLMHLVVQCKSEKLIDAIATLEPVIKSLNTTTKNANYNIVTSIATHHLTPLNVLKILIKKSNTYVKTLIALRKDCDEVMQNVLYEDGDEDVLLSLSQNSSLDKNIAKSLIKDDKYIKNIAKYITLDDELFDILVKLNKVELAQNESILHHMQEHLISLHNEDVKLALASNTHIDESTILELVSEGSLGISLAVYANIRTPKDNLESAYANPANHQALAYNESTPKEILLKLANSEDEEVLMELAKNISTPIEVLYQLQLDSRFQRAVKENSSFGKHIQTENIGWEV
ncbi:hypothetical protein [Sulfurimonas sp.]